MRAQAAQCHPAFDSHYNLCEFTKKITLVALFGSYIPDLDRTYVYSRQNTIALMKYAISQEAWIETLCIPYIRTSWLRNCHACSFFFFFFATASNKCGHTTQWVPSVVVHDATFPTNLLSPRTSFINMRKTAESYLASLAKLLLTVALLMQKHIKRLPQKSVRLSTCNTLHDVLLWAIRGGIW